MVHWVTETIRSYLEQANLWKAQEQGKLIIFTISTCGKILKHLQSYIQYKFYNTMAM